MQTIYKNSSKEPGIYKITCTTNQYFYVGSCKEFKRRLRGHLASLRKGTHHSKKMQNVFNKHGEDSFVFEVLEVMIGSTEFDRQLKEQIYLDDLWCSEIMNIRKKSDKVAYRKPVSDETKAKMSLKAKTNPNCVASQFKQGHKGLSGCNNPMFGKPSPTKGRPLSEEHKRKIGQKNKERMLALWQNQDYAQKQSKAHVGKHSSPETEFKSGDQHISVLRKAADTQSMTSTGSSTSEL